VRWFAIILALLFAGPITALNVTDGDTFSDQGVTYRLEGIDAPELAQVCGTAQTRQWKCGEQAKEYLARLMRAGEVRCSRHGTDAYGRVIATCSAGGVDLGAQMVASGHAWAFTKYSTRYVDEEKQALFAKLGIWSAPSVPAWEYRERAWTASAQRAPANCPIKGNISKNGRIYHTPWSRWYAKTRINTSKGERWFCSEAEALAAGWRSARW